MGRLNVILNRMSTRWIVNVSNKSKIEFKTQKCPNISSTRRWQTNMNWVIGVMKQKVGLETWIIKGARIRLLMVKNVLIGIILFYGNGLPGMKLWSAGTSSMFRTLRPSQAGYEVCACSGRPLERRATVRDPLGGSIGTRQECCRHADRAHGVTIGWSDELFFSLTLSGSVETVARKAKRP